MFEVMKTLTAGADFSGGPTPEDVTAYYVRRAPERLPLIDSTAGKGPGSLRIARRDLRLHGREPYPAVTNVQAVDLTGRGRRDLIACDMRFGEVLLIDVLPAEGIRRVLRLGRVPHPAHTHVVDLDGDGQRDVVVANLGTVTPSDVTNGTIEWLRQTEDLVFERHTLADGLGRVADVRAADFDGDGDVDLIAAVFGWRRVGNVLYLENIADRGGPPRFTQHVIDDRPGSIHVPVTDLDGDGRPDFVALFAQQHEKIVAFLNRGGGGFEALTLYEAPHPHWGSSGIDLVDFDGDGDLDILFANGDSLDEIAVKPWHGLGWVENRGIEGAPWPYRRLTDLYGAHFAKAGDLDGDGDADVVLAAFLPFVRGDRPEDRLVESLIWLERTSSGSFERHSLETATPFYPTLDIADLDADGDLDVICGDMTLAKRPEDTIDHVLVVFENLRN